GSAAELEHAAAARHAGQEGWQATVLDRGRRPARDPRRAVALICVGRSSVHCLWPVARAIRRGARSTQEKVTACWDRGRLARFLARHMVPAGGPPAVPGRHHAFLFKAVTWRNMERAVARTTAEVLIRPANVPVIEGR